MLKNVETEKRLYESEVRRLNPPSLTVENFEDSDPVWSLCMLYNLGGRENHPHPPQKRKENPRCQLSSSHHLKTMMGLRQFFNVATSNNATL